LTDFVPYRGHRDNKKSTARPYHFYNFLLNFQNIKSVEQKNNKNIFLDFFFELTVAILKMADRTIKKKLKIVKVDALYRGQKLQKG
jgi:hypothetical protein